MFTTSVGLAGMCSLYSALLFTTNAGRRKVKNDLKKSSAVFLIARGDYLEQSKVCFDGQVFGSGHQMFGCDHQLLKYSDEKLTAQNLVEYIMT